MTDENPYATPAANLDPGQPAKQGYRLRAPVAVDAGRGWGWIADGFGYFKTSPFVWIGTLLVGLLIFIAASFIPVVGQLAIMLTSYVFAGGIMMGCDAQARGREFKFMYLFAGFQRPRKLIMLSVVSSLASVAIMVAIIGPVYLEMLKPGASSNPELNAVMMDAKGFWLPFLVAMLVMIPLMAAVWFAPALIAINDVSLGEALKLSFMGCIKNVLPMLLYGIFATLLYIAAIIPLLLGLFVFLPTMVASIYASYKDIFLEPVEH